MNKSKVRQVHGSAVVKSMVLSDVDDAQLSRLMNAAPSKRALAKQLSVAPSTLDMVLRRRGLIHPKLQTVRKGKPKLTREALYEALQPPNNCQVKSFHEKLDEDSREVLDEALKYDKRDLSASRLREFLIGQGFADSDVPGVSAINAHRTGTRPCRCRG